MSVAQPAGLWYSVCHIKADKVESRLRHLLLLRAEVTGNTVSYFHVLNECSWRRE